jgi:hypothetical protein
LFSFVGVITKFIEEWLIYLSLQWGK